MNDDSSPTTDPRVATRQYDSFVVRCWQVAHDEQRVDVEHLQSGGRTRVLTLAAAADWMGSECGLRGERCEQDTQGGIEPATRRSSTTTE
jgi:hypothetical protein